MLIRFFGSEQGNFVPLYHTQVMKDIWAYNFETMLSIKYIISTYHSIRKKV